MIRFIISLNKQGKLRLSKWFINYSDLEKQRFIQELYKIMNIRDTRFTNFIEFRNYKIVFRRFAGLYFLICIDMHDNEMIHMEFIQLLVEIMDSYFGNVCELDLIFNYHKLYVILDELIIGGEVFETSKLKILEKLKNIEQLS